MEATNTQCESFFNFLKNTYKLNKRVPVLHCHPVPRIYLEKHRINVTGYASCKKDRVEIHVASGREIVSVFHTIAHEYKHCLQRYNELSWIGTGLSPTSSPLEDAANAFAEVSFKGIYSAVRQTRSACCFGWIVQEAL